MAELATINPVLMENINNSDNPKTSFFGSITPSLGILIAITAVLAIILIVYLVQREMHKKKDTTKSMLVPVGYID
jgi:hypothetical protein